MEHDSENDELSIKYEQARSLFSMCKKDPTTMRLLLDKASERGIYKRKFNNYIELTKGMIFMAYV